VLPSPPAKTHPANPETISRVRNTDFMMVCISDINLTALQLRYASAEYYLQMAGHRNRNGAVKGERNRKPHLIY